MSPSFDQEQHLLAAEHALGLLEGSELSRARELMLSSRQFRQAVREWEISLAPIADEASEQPPPTRLWQRIDQAATSEARQATVHDLRRRLLRWKGLSFAAMAVAAAAVLFVAVPRQGTPAPPAETNAILLLATLSSPQTDTAIAAAYDRRAQSLLVQPGVLAKAPGRQHEVWIIPAGGTPVAVGLLAPDRPQRLAVRAEIAPHFRGRSTLAVSVEPIGGSPTGQPTGPVIAAGEFSPI